MSKITSISSSSTEEFVYDAVCDAPHSYITNGLVSHNCVLWVDEIEKGIAGVQSSGRSDSGVTARVFSTFLTWMQEKKSPVFVIATANNVNEIPPEFMRAGRFDEIFFADVPNRRERIEIFAALLRRKKRDIKKFDLQSLTMATEGFTGAELEKAIELAMFDAFENGKDITTQDIIACTGRFMPLSKTLPEVIGRMREWAKERCLMANSPEPSQQAALTRGKAIDL